MPLQIDGKISGTEIYAWQAALMAADFAFIQQKQVIPEEIKSISKILNSGEEQFISQNAAKALQAHLITGKWVLGAGQIFGDIQLSHSNWQTYNQVIEDLDRGIKSNRFIEVEVTHKNSTVVTESLLAKHGVHPFQAQVVEQFEGNAKNGLALLFLDRGHDDAQFQKSLRNSLLSYFQVNPNSKFLGFEGVSGIFRLPTQQNIIFPFRNRSVEIASQKCLNQGSSLIAEMDQDHTPIPAAIALLCLQGSALTFFGIEMRGIMGQLRNIDAQISHTTHPSLLLDLLFKKYDLHYARGYFGTQNFVRYMNDNSLPFAPLVYGAGHANEIRKSLQEMGVSYVVVEP